MTKRAVLYARINNHDEPKLAEQLRLCREYAHDRGWQVVAELADRGVSGLSDKAPQLEQALTMAGAGEFDVLVVREPNRISRNLTKLLAITEEFKQANVQVKFVCNRSSDNGTSGTAVEMPKEIIIYVRVSDNRECHDMHSLESLTAILRGHDLKRERRAT